MSEPDENGWRVIDADTPKDERVILFYPNMGKGYEAFQSISKAFTPEAQWWKPTHWRPQLPPPGKTEKVEVKA